MEGTVRRGTKAAFYQDKYNVQTQKGGERR